MRISDRGLKFIADFEGFIPHLYNDAAKPPNATIGYGHLVHKGPINGTEPPQFTRGITLQEGLELLRCDAAVAEEAVNRLVRVTLNQNQFDALVSFAFNAGGGALGGSTALKKINAGDLAGGAAELNKWVNSGANKKVPGLIRRRAAEERLFNTPC